jgi:aspartokinase
MTPVSVDERNKARVALQQMKDNLIKSIAVSKEETSITSIINLANIQRCLEALYEH